MNKSKKDIILKTLSISLIIGVLVSATIAIILSDIDNTVRMGLGFIVGIGFGFVIIYLTERE